MGDVGEVSAIGEGDAEMAGDDGDDGANDDGSDDEGSDSDSCRPSCFTAEYAGGRLVFSCKPISVSTLYQVVML